MLKKEISDEEITKRIVNFLQEHKKHYTEEEIEFLIANATWGRYTDFVNSDLRQIYDYLGLLETDNIHTGFMRIIEKNFPHAKKVVEIGCGKVPSLSARLAQKYHLTVYDPRIIEGLYGERKFRIKKEIFTRDTDIEGADLIIGFMPNGAHTAIVDSAVKHDTDFIIAMSDMADENEIDSEEIDYYIGNKKYEIDTKVQKSGLGKLCTEYLEEYDDEFPVIYNKR